MVEFDVEHVDGAVEPLQAGEFLRDVDAEMIGHLDVAALHDDLCLRGRGGRLVDISQHLGRIHGLA